VARRKQNQSPSRIASRVTPAGDKALSFRGGLFVKGSMKNGKNGKAKGVKRNEFVSFPIPTTDWAQSVEGKLWDYAENNQPPKPSSKLKLPRSRRFVVEVKGGGTLYTDNNLGLWLIGDPRRGEGCFNVTLFESMEWFKCSTAMRPFRIVSNDGWGSWLGQVQMSLASHGKRKGWNPEVHRGLPQGGAR